MDSGISREEATRIIRRACGDTLPRQGDLLVLDERGGFRFLPFGLVPTSDVDDNYDVRGRDVLILGNASGGAFSVYLPPAESAVYRLLVIKKIDASANAITVDPDGAETIDGSSSYSLSSQWDFLIIVSDGSSWYRIG